MCWILAEIVAISNPNRFLQKHVADANIGHFPHFRAGEHTRYNFHVGLYHYVCAESGDHRIRFHANVHVDHRLLRPLPVQHGLRRIDVGEEILQTIIDEAGREEALAAREG